MLHTCKEHNTNLRDEILISNRFAGLWISNSQQMARDGLRINSCPTSFYVLQQIFVYFVTIGKVSLAFPHVLHEACTQWGPLTTFKLHPFQSALVQMKPKGLI
jgi:hypothetical protein